MADDSEQPADASEASVHPSRHASAAPSARAGAWLAAACVLAFAGCSADVKAPKASSVAEIKARTLARIDRFEKAIEENKVHPQDVKDLGASLVWLKGHMQATKVGTEDQVRAIDEALDVLRGSDMGHMKPPEDWKPSDGPPPPPLIQPGPVKDLLPQIRKIISEIPDSDARPESKGSAAP